MANKYNKDNSDLLTENSQFIFNQRISWYKKSKKNFEWAEQCADYIDHVYSPIQDKSRYRRLKMNYDLYNGNGQEAMDLYGDYYDYSDGDEDMQSGYENVPHHPAMEQIAKTMVGEQQQKALNPIAVDTSSYANNQRKRKRLELLQEYLQKEILDPIIQQAQMQIMMENNIQDPYSLNPQQQQELQSQTQQRAQAMTPKEIHEYMRKDYKGPSEIQAQRIVEFLTDYLDLKYATDEGFKHAIITGEEVYRVGIRHNMPFVEHVDAMGFFHIARPNSRFVEEGVAWKYEQFVMYNDIYAWHGDEVDADPYIRRKLETYARELNRSPRKPGASDPKLVATVAANPAIIDAAPDIRTKEGQEYMKHLYSGPMGVASKGGDIRYTHLAWKSLRKLYYITRVNKKSGGLERFWVDESYKPNKRLDVKVETHWVPEVWETTKIGMSDGIYFQKQPIPYQHKSLNNPWDVKGPYVGAIYSKLMNNTEATSPMDLAKPYQYKYNIQMAKIAETESRDIGKILTMSFHAKPKNWSWKKWLLMAKNKGVLPIDLTKEGVTPMDAQAFRGIDLSTVDRLANQLQYLDFLRNQIALAMSYNPSRLGMVGSEVSVTNNQQNIVQSAYQTYDLYNTHNKIVENLYNHLVNTARVAFKDNPPVANYVLDDMSIAELNVDWEMLWRSELAIKVRNSSDDFENILQLKRLTQPMIQNGLVSFTDLIRIQGAKSWSEIQNIAESAEERMERKQAEEQQRQQEMMEQQQAMQQQLVQMQQEFEMMKQDKELASRERQSQIESQRFALQKDIDGNKINDDIQKAEAEMVMKKDEQIRELQFKLEGLQEEIRKNKKAEELKEKELKIKEMEAKAKIRQASKPSSSKT